jgi:membrane-associated phospholipid phosphatase
MNPDIARAAQTLAEHALLLLAIGIVLIGVALVGVVAAVRVARRHQEPLAKAGAWLLAQVYRIPILGPWLRSARGFVPSKFLLLHLVLGLVATAATLAFLIVAEEVFAGETVAQFDRAFAAALQNNSSPRWQRLFLIITRFGSDEVLTTASAIVAVGLLVRRAYVLAIGWIVAQAGGGFLLITLKGAFERSRPELPDGLSASGWSFPSGHAMSTFVFCGLAAYLLLRSTRSTSVTVMVVVITLAWCLVIGFTRLYLGAHFASDVAAGLMAAAAWVAVCISAIELGLRRRVTR